MKKQTPLLVVAVSICVLALGGWIGFKAYRKADFERAEREKDFAGLARYLVTDNPYRLEADRVMEQEVRAIIDDIARGLDDERDDTFIIGLMQRLKSIEQAIKPAVREAIQSGDPEQIRYAQFGISHILMEESRVLHYLEEAERRLPGMNRECVFLDFLPLFVEFSLDPALSERIRYEAIQDTYDLLRIDAETAYDKYAGPLETFVTALIEGPLLREELHLKEDLYLRVAYDQIALPDPLAEMMTEQGSNDDDSIIRDVSAKIRKKRGL